jgi:DNA-directed RNA polymerase subunit L
MKIEVLENEGNKLKIKMHDSLTLVNLINENIWQQKGIEISAYATEHPYLSQPVLLVKSKNPKKAVLDAAQQIVDDVKDIRRQFQAQLK